MLDLLQYEFIQNAIWASLLTSLLCGMVGALVVVNRMTMLAGGVAHAAYGGVGAAFYLGLPVLPMTLGFGLLSGLFMAGVSRKDKQKADMLIGVVWAAGMAIGILLLDLTPGYNVDLMSYLFGSILSVNHNDIWVMSVVVVGLLLAIIVFYRPFVAASFDPDFAETRGVRTRFFHYLLVGVAAVSVVLMIRVVGLVLVIALITIPTYISLKHSVSLKGLMVRTSILSLFFCLVGLVCSVKFDVTAGASIIAVATIAFCASIMLERIRSVLSR